MERVAIYARVSTQEQNVQMQIDDLREYCMIRKWKVVQVFEDQMSGTTANRKNLQAMNKAAHQRKFDIILVWRLDRAFRSLQDCIHHLNEWDSRGVQFISFKDSGIDTSPDNPSGRLLLFLISAFSEFEASIIRMRVKAGVQAKIAKTGKLRLSDKSLENSPVNS